MFSVYPSLHKTITGLMLLVMAQGLNMAQASPLEQLQKVGEAKLEVLFWDIYFSELYTLDGQFNKGQVPVALNIRYLRNITSEELVERTAEEWDGLGISPNEYRSWLRQLADMWPDIRKGDELMVWVDENKTSQFFFNQQPIGEIQDSAFGGTFLAIWLDENCSYPKVRNKLLGITQ